MSPLSLVVALLAAAHAVSQPQVDAAPVLTGGNLTVLLDSQFPRPLTYTLATTGESFDGALVSPEFGLSLSINQGQVSCGGSALVTTYSYLPLSATPPGSEGVSFVIHATCILNFGTNASLEGQQQRRRAVLPPIVYLQFNGSVVVSGDPAVPQAGIMTWELQSVAVIPGGTGQLDLIRSVDVAGFELISFRPVDAASTPACFYAPDDNGKPPACGGDTYFVDMWSNSGLDEWYAPTWSSQTVSGQVDINTPAGNQASCMYGAASRLAPGPLQSVIVGGWSPSRKTGIGAVSSQSHTPFWSGPRSFDAPGRCSRFTVASSTIFTSFLCGSPLPFRLTVGVFSDVTSDGIVSADDLHFWRRHRFPRADLLYRTTVPYKLGLDYDAYVPQHDWVRIPFVPDALLYAANLSVVMDGYPQTPILVGWQGLGHDTLYPSLDVVNPALGGAQGLAALGTGIKQLGAGSTLSYHVNTDEAYSHYNGAPNPEFDVGMCRLQVDHLTPWFSNCSVTHEQTPDCGIRCSISKTRDAVSHDRYARIARMLPLLPPDLPLRTIHSDAWRDVGASWEPTGFVPFQSESFCGQRGDADFWASHGASLGCEGQNGQATELMGLVTYYYHGDGWDVATWGRVVTGSSLGFDNDVFCGNPGGKCTWEQLADSFYLSARLYQLALTDELLGTWADSQATDEGAPDLPHHRFAAGGKIYTAHVATSVASETASHPGSQYSPPSTWPFGGDSIPVANGAGGVLLPLVEADGATLSPFILHAYAASSGGKPPKPVNTSCPLFTPGGYSLANNTAVGNWDKPTLSFELDPTWPELQAVTYCNASCWSNASCAAWDLIKVTPTSGKTKPLCSLFTAPAGCESDTNQWAGAKAPLPIPAPSGPTLNQTWTLPLSWVGKALSATTISPGGPLPGQPAIQVLGDRQLLLVGVTPGWPVRLTAT